MKKSISFLALLLLISFACNKGTDSQMTEGQSITGNTNEVQTQAGDRDICCCNVVVSSTVFEGLTICGVYGPGNGCSIRTSNCGYTCGVEKVLPQPNKNANFCYQTECPICFTNNSPTYPIQIYLSCTSGNSTPFWIPAGGTLCFMADCTGSLQPCD